MKSPGSGSSISSSLSQGEEELLLVEEVGEGTVVEAGMVETVVAGVLLVVKAAFIRGLESSGSGVLNQGDLPVLYLLL